MFHASFSLQFFPHFFFHSVRIFSHRNFKSISFFLAVIFSERKRFSNVVFGRFSVHFLEIFAEELWAFVKLRAQDRGLENEYSCSFERATLLRKGVLLYKNIPDFSFSVHKFRTHKRKTRKKRTDSNKREKKNAKTRPKIEQIYLIIRKEIVFVWFYWTSQNEMQRKKHRTTKRNVHDSSENNTAAGSRYMRFCI